MRAPGPAAPCGWVMRSLAATWLARVTQRRRAMAAIRPERLRGCRPLATCRRWRLPCRWETRQVGTGAAVGTELVKAHHGSLSRQRRLLIEDELKRGELRGLVATSTLELGIDMGAVDLVVQVASPGSVASGLQRIGRAGHRVGEPSRGRIFPKHRADLLEAAAVVERMHAGGGGAHPLPAQPPRCCRPARSWPCAPWTTGPPSGSRPCCVAARASPSCPTRCSTACSTCCRAPTRPRSSPS